MIDYIVNDYFKNIAAGNVAALVTDLMLIVYVMLVFNEPEWTWRGIGRMAIEMLSIWAIRLTLSALIYAIPSLFNLLSSYNTMYVVYPLVLTSYLLLFSKRKAIFKVLQGVSFYAFYILCFSLGYDVMTIFQGIPHADLLMMSIQIASMLVICFFLRSRDLSGFLYLSNSAASGVESGNKIIDCLINAENAKAVSRGVLLDCKTKVSKTIPYGEIDLCALLFNIIDNAIEATDACKEAENRTIDLSVRENGEFLMIRCVNPVREELLVRDSQNICISTKKGENHGYGLKIIRDIVKRYDGEMNISVKEGRFVLDIMLQSVKQEKENE